MEHASAPASGIEHANPPGEGVGETRHERQDVRLERGHHRLAAVLGHHVVKPRELLVGHAAALPEALDDRVFDAAQERDVLREHRDVVGTGRARHRGGVLGRQAEGDRRRVDVDDTGRDHGAEPLADVAFVQPGPARQSGRGHRRLIAHRVEEGRPVTDRRHQAERSAVEVAQQTAGKGLSFLRIEWWHSQIIAWNRGSREAWEP